MIGSSAETSTPADSQTPSIRAAVDRVEELHGRLDGAFNNGAVIQQPGPLDATSEEDIDKQFAVGFHSEGRAIRDPRRPDQ